MAARTSPNSTKDPRYPVRHFRSRTLQASVTHSFSRVQSLTVQPIAPTAPGMRSLAAESTAKAQASSSFDNMMPNFAISNICEPHNARRPSDLIGTRADTRVYPFSGEWWTETANSSWGDGTWAGRWGYNFEVGNVFTLNSDGYSEDEGSEFFTTLGAEWSEAPIIPEVSQYRLAS
ncbi:hypothetical protein LTS10_002089 [Elasticomyces elasticus]|nr:hypothetical protein LTS10_002089 [Elasticomyces elasticus]